MNLCETINDNMVAYREMYNILEASFEGCELKHIARGSNDEADTLANIGSTCSPIPDGVFYEVINNAPSSASIQRNQISTPKLHQAPRQHLPKKLTHPII